jgi:protein SCO1/2
MFSRVLLGLAVVLAAAAGFFAGAYHDRRSSAGSDLAPIRPAPQYVLTNQLGRPVSSASFDGKVQIVTFLFPYCTTYCPLIAAELVRFEDAIRGTTFADRVRIVAFNVDPQGSGPPQMRAFLRQYGWNPEDTRWQFLTGSPAEIRRVVTRGYMVGYERESLAQEARDEARERAQGTYIPQPSVENPLAAKAHVDYDVGHNDVLEIVGPDGRIEKIFDEAERVPDDQLLAVVQRLLRGKPQS